MAATALNCNTMLRIMYIMLNYVSGVDCGSPSLLPQLSIIPIDQKKTFKIITLQNHSVTVLMVGKSPCLEVYDP